MCQPVLSSGCTQMGKMWFFLNSVVAHTVMGGQVGKQVIIMQNDLWDKGHGIRDSGDLGGQIQLLLRSLGKDFPKETTEWNHEGKKGSSLGKLGKNSPLAVRESLALYYNMRPFRIWSLVLSQFHCRLFLLWLTAVPSWPVLMLMLFSLPGPLPSLQIHTYSLGSVKVSPTCFSFPSWKDQLPASLHFLLWGELGWLMSPANSCPPGTSECNLIWKYSFADIIS